MEKISGIIPSSPRLQAVDLSNSPVRPGAPAFGRPEGISSLKAAAVPQFDTTTPAMTTAQKAIGVQNEMLGWRAKDQRNAQIAAEMSNRFFMKTDRREQQQATDVTNGAGAYAAGLPVGLVAVQSTPAGFKTDEITAPRETVRPEVFEDEPGEEIELQQPEGLFPKGSFIDRTV